MKKAVIIGLSVLLAAGIIAACAPAFDPDLGGDFSHRSLETNKYYFTLAASASTLVKQVAPSKNFQTITLTTTAVPVAGGSSNNDFNLYINPTANGAGDYVIPGVNVYPITDGRNDGVPPILPDTAHSLRYTAVKTGTNTVVLRLPLDETAISLEGLVVVADPATVSFNESPNHKRLNMDGDKNIGEAAAADGNSYSDDVYIEYFSVDVTTNFPSATPATLVGFPVELPATTLDASAIGLQDPPATTPSADLKIAGGTKLILDGFIDSTPSGLLPPSGPVTLNTASTNFTKEMVKSAFTFQKWNYGGKKWDTIDVEVSDPTTDSSSPYTDGYFTLTFPASQVYDIYRYNIDRYKIVEKNAVLGFKHRADNDESKLPGYYSSSTWVEGWSYFDIVNYPVPGGANDPEPFIPITDSHIGLTFLGVPGAYYLNVTVSEPANVRTGTLAVETGSLTKDNIWLTYSPTSGTSDLVKIPLENSLIQVIDRNEFRIYLPSTFVASPSGEIAIYLNNVTVSYSKAGATPDDDKPLTGVKLAASESHASIVQTVSVP